MRNLFITLCLWSTLSAASDFPIVVDPVVSATPPGANVTAGYFTLVNETSADITITGAYSPTIAKVEIHQSVIKDDVAKMVLQQSLNIEPGASLEFSHGGYHLMLMELTEPLSVGQTVDVILVTSIGDMLIEMPVRKFGATKDNSTLTDAKTDHSHNDNANHAEKISSN